VRSKSTVARAIECDYPFIVLACNEFVNLFQLGRTVDIHRRGEFDEAILCLSASPALYTSVRAASALS
jgi:hypothetical protein